MDCEDTSRIRRHLRLLRGRLAALNVAVQAAPSELSSSAIQASSGIRDEGYLDQGLLPQTSRKRPRTVVYTSRNKEKSLTQGKALNAAQFGHSGSSRTAANNMNHAVTYEALSPVKLKRWRLLEDSSQLRLSGSVGKLAITILDSLQETMVKLQHNPVHVDDANEIGATRSPLEVCAVDDCHTGFSQVPPLLHLAAFQVGRIIANAEVAVRSKDSGVKVAGRQSASTSSGTSGRAATTIKNARLPLHQDDKTAAEPSSLDDFYDDLPVPSRSTVLLSHHLHLTISLIPATEEFFPLFSSVTQLLAAQGLHHSVPTVVLSVLDKGITSTHEAKLSEAPTLSNRQTLLSTKSSESALEIVSWCHLDAGQDFVDWIRARIREEILQMRKISAEPQLGKHINVSLLPSPTTLLYAMAGASWSDLHVVQVLSQMLSLALDKIVFGDPEWVKQSISSSDMTTEVDSAVLEKSTKSNIMPGLKRRVLLLSSELETDYSGDTDGPQLAKSSEDAFIDLDGDNDAGCNLKQLWLTLSDDVKQLVADVSLTLVSKSLLLQDLILDTLKMEGNVQAPVGSSSE
ncbi:hypothetical protein M427DRAFT_342747 [Gonapodya prolifera JEL478]|uniref:Uncharacterized protein n=1 Tax=Gonapodya prolifera (strain JEL478) TaxID=1344416 RepID=A0A139AVG5_GONPJ|nr:hypothetical protein M427DRAFT_342747 [Gonapodya prolifera JEL478]|eukprot:KXS20694.1 hypothetical protein M427DRAFT_342747 [Gonapodya prolifera JEL478]